MINNLDQVSQGTLGKNNYKEPINTKSVVGITLIVIGVLLAGVAVVLLLGFSVIIASIVVGVVAVGTAAIGSGLFIAGKKEEKNQNVNILLSPAPAPTLDSAPALDLQSELKKIEDLVNKTRVLKSRLKVMEWWYKERLEFKSIKNEIVGNLKVLLDLEDYYNNLCILSREKKSQFNKITELLNKGNKTFNECKIYDEQTIQKEINKLDDLEQRLKNHNS